MNKRILNIVVGGLLLLAAGLVTETRAADEEKGLKFGGSIRGRYEYINWMNDSVADGETKDDRGRFRYRLRFDAKAKINPNAGAYFRLVSGTDSRSGNVTLGDNPDFGPDSFSIRYAAMVITPWDDGLLPSGNGKWAFDFGRVKNAYKWKGHGKDMMMWDGDISLAGVGTQFSHKLGDKGNFFVQTGYYVIDENSSNNTKDPYMAPIQGGVTFGGDTSFGIRASYYHMSELDRNFIMRGAYKYPLEDMDDPFSDKIETTTDSAGNIEDGLTGDPNGGTLNVVESQVFFTTPFGPMPLTISGGYANNTSAKASVMFEGVAKNSVAWNAGFEIGNKTSMLMGLGWYHIEANAFPSQFIDSDLLDGYTNREGGLIFLTRTIMKNTDLGVQFFRSDAIDKSESMSESVKNSKRNRFQLDMIYKF